MEQIKELIATIITSYQASKSIFSYKRQQAY